MMDTTAEPDSNMSPATAAEQSARAIHDLGATFMLDPQTYAMAAEAGYEGTAFYFGGRGGVLGDVTAQEVADAFIFFPLETAQTNWDSARAVETRSESAKRFANAAHVWATEHLPDAALDYARLAELADVVIQSADGSEAAVFEGWRALEEPSGARELAIHRINALRELRFARHGSAVREVGLEPVQAFMIKTPYMAPVFGWPQPTEDPSEEQKQKWDRAEQLTNERFGQDLAVLDQSQLVEFCQLVNAALEASN